MSRPIQITIHPSQFPDKVRADLLQSLRTREMNHKFHYDSVKQAQKWLALHKTYSPIQTDSHVSAIYDAIFEAALAFCHEPLPIHLVALGCGGGEKELRLLRRVCPQDRRVSYTPSDVSVALVLIASQNASRILDEGQCYPLVCDLESAGDLREVIARGESLQATRIVTFFGLAPNFSPPEVLSILDEIVRSNDLLLFSANLAPGADYEAGIKKVFPLYDNPLTRDWLLTALLDLGVEREDGQIDFAIEDCPFQSGLKRIAAYYRFHRARVIDLGEESFHFGPGDRIRLFFSYRHTPAHIRTSLQKRGFALIEQAIAQSEEEGVFLFRRE